MNWDAVSTIADIVGAVAVVISLIYVARQIRQNTQASRSATRQAIADSALVAVSDLLTDSGMAELITRDLAKEELAPHETLRLQSRGYMCMRHWENIYYQYRSGMLLEDEWQGFRRNLKVLLQLRHIREYWDREAEIYSNAFREEVERMAGEIAQEPNTFWSSLQETHKGGEPPRGVA